MRPVIKVKVVRPSNSKPFTAGDGVSYQEYIVEAADGTLGLASAPTDVELKNGSEAYVNSFEFEGNEISAIV